MKHSLPLIEANLSFFSAFSGTVILCARLTSVRGKENAPRYKCPERFLFAPSHLCLPQTWIRHICTTVKMSVAKVDYFLFLSNLTSSSNSLLCSLGRCSLRKHALFDDEKELLLFTPLRYSREAILVFPFSIFSKATIDLPVTRKRIQNWVQNYIQSTGIIHSFISLPLHHFVAQSPIGSIRKLWYKNDSQVRTLNKNTPRQ